jgi:hypothetical protein
MPDAYEARFAAVAPLRRRLETVARAGYDRPVQARRLPAVAERSSAPKPGHDGAG